MGLAIACSIVVAHAGTIGVKCRAGQGTAVKVRLPRSLRGYAMTDASRAAPSDVQSAIAQARFGLPQAFCGPNDAWLEAAPAYGKALDDVGGQGLEDATVNVSIGDNFFSPSSNTINVGNTVVWTNNGALPHTTTSDDAL